MIDDRVIQFKESILVDLTYHMLCHCNISHISNLFSPEYIARFSQNAEDRELIAQIEATFNSNFDELDAINFLPYYADDLADYLAKIERNMVSDDVNVQKAIGDITKYLSGQHSAYKIVWDAHKKSSKENDEKFMEYVRRNRSIEAIHRLLGKDIAVYNSISLLKFGRGLGEKDGKITVAVQFPENGNEPNKALFAILHELTHSITNPLIDDGDIAADPNLDENLAVLFDYQLLFKYDPDMVTDYLATMGDWFGTTCRRDDIEQKFPINPKYKAIMLMNAVLE